jgi:aquaporin Z
MELELMKVPGVLFFSEFVGTALLISVGLSIVILDFSPDSHVVALLPSAGLRRLLTGFLFGTTGGIIALSPVGKISGAHINPVVTAAFWLRKKMSAGHALGYILAQFTGAIAGAVPLLLWGRTGEGVHYGATLPGAQYTYWEAALGEMATTFALIVLLFLFLGHKPIRKFTPLLFPFLYAAMVYLEAPLSGTSTNPARSLGPEVISWEFRTWWVYWVGPALGMLLGLGIYKYTWLKRLEIEVAKLYHFEHDPFQVFRGKKGANLWAKK